MTSAPSSSESKKKPVVTTAAMAVSAAKKKTRDDSKVSKEKKQSKATGSSGGNGGGWMNALLNFARHPERYTDAVVDIDDDTLTVVDKYNKAAHHWLVLPRRQLELNRVTELTRAHIPLLQHMITRARHVIATQQSKDHSTFTYQLGFHAVPSMKLLHLHVISQDYDSISLKHKKHWNSFTTPFFIVVDYAIEQLQQHGRITIDEHAYENLLTRDLACHRCASAFSTIPSLKQHILACTVPVRAIDNAAFARTLPTTTTASTATAPSSATATSTS